MNETLKVLESRRSCRSFKPDMIKEEELKRISKIVIPPSELINSIGEEISKAVGVPWLPSDFKKKDGENRSVEISERLGIYRQLYCGCRYSLSAREAGTPDNNREDTE